MNSKTRETWLDLVEENEDRTPTIGLPQRNAIADINTYLEALEVAAKFDLLAFARIVELVREARMSHNPRPILDIIHDLASAPSLRAALGESEAN